MISTLYEAFIRNIGGGAGRKLRYWYYRKKLGACGKNVIIDTHVTILNPRQVFIGSNVWIDHHVMIMAGGIKDDRKCHRKANPAYKFKEGELHIGDETHIASFVILQAHGGMSVGSRLTIGAGSKLYSLSHHYRDSENNTNYLFGTMVLREKQSLVASPVVVSDEAAVGLNCTLFPGAYVPEGTWLGVGMTVRNEKLQPRAVYQVRQEWILKAKGAGDK